MKTYNVYVSSSRSPSTIAVKKGFSWPAFIIGPLWFLLNKMWLTFLLSVAFTYGAPMALRVFERSATPNAALLYWLLFGAFFAIWFFTGVVANFMLGEELVHRGYKLCSSISARNSNEAIDSVGRAEDLGEETTGVV